VVTRYTLIYSRCSIGNMAKFVTQSTAIHAHTTASASQKPSVAVAVAVAADAAVGVGVFFDGDTDRRRGITSSL